MAPPASRQYYSQKCTMNSSKMQQIINCNSYWWQWDAEVWDYQRFNVSSCIFEVWTPQCFGGTLLAKFTYHDGTLIHLQPKPGIHGNGWLGVACGVMHCENCLLTYQRQRNGPIAAVVKSKSKNKHHQLHLQYQYPVARRLRQDIVSQLYNHKSIQLVCWK